MNAGPQCAIGWDIGGANLKAALITLDAGRVIDREYQVRSFEVWNESKHLSKALREMGCALNWKAGMAMGVTMTAELADAFRSKREGVLFVLEELRRAFGEDNINIFDLDGGFQPLSRAARDPLSFAATNWIASAMLVARLHPDCLFMDIGSTTTDIIPIVEGQIRARGRTDPERLARGELVYSGMLRTNPNTIVRQVPFSGEYHRVAAEYFSIMGDVYRILGRINSVDYTCASPDGRSASTTHCRERLARLICADVEMLKTAATDSLAAYIAEKQVQQVSEAMWQVLSNFELSGTLPMVATGPGAFIAMEAAHRLGLSALDLTRDWGQGAPESLPAFAVAVLLADTEREAAFDLEGRTA